MAFQGDKLQKRDFAPVSHGVSQQQPGSDAENYGWFEVFQKMSVATGDNAERTTCTREWLEATLYRVSILQSDPLYANPSQFYALAYVYDALVGTSTETSTFQSGARTQDFRTIFAVVPAADKVAATDLALVAGYQEVFAADTDWLAISGFAVGVPPGAPPGPNFSPSQRYLGWLRASGMSVGGATMLITKDANAMVAVGPAKVTVPARVAVLLMLGIMEERPVLTPVRPLFTWLGEPSAQARSMIMRSAGRLNVTSFWNDQYWPTQAIAQAVTQLEPLDNWDAAVDMLRALSVDPGDYINPASAEFARVQELYHKGIRVWGDLSEDIVIEELEKITNLQQARRSDNVVFRGL